MAPLTHEAGPETSDGALAALGLRLISESETRRHIDIETASQIISKTYRSMAQGESRLSSPSRLQVSGPPHHLGVKGASLGDRDLAGVRLTSRARSLLLLWRLSEGRPFALIDESWLYRFRTGVSAAVVAACLFPDARPRTVALIGAGPIAWEMALALDHLLSPQHLRIAARHASTASDFVRRLTEAGIAAEAAPNAIDAVKDADLVITITSATQPFLRADHMRPDVVVLSMGGGPELDFDLWQRAGNRYVDDLEYALTRGDAAGWIAAGQIRAEDLGASLSGTIPDLAAGQVPARATKGGPTLAIVQGVATLDVALAGVVLDRLVAA